MKKKTSINNHSYLNLCFYRRTLTLLFDNYQSFIMSDKPHDTPNPLLEDERKNPVYRLGQAVAGFMLLVWAGVLALVFFLVFRFWLN